MKPNKPKLSSTNLPVMGKPTLRDCFAMSALPSLISPKGDDSFAVVSDLAYSYADCMLRARGKTSQSALLKQYFVRLSTPASTEYHLVECGHMPSVEEATDACDIQIHGDEEFVDVIEVDRVVSIPSPEEKAMEYWKGEVTWTPKGQAQDSDGNVFDGQVICEHGEAWFHYREWDVEVPTVNGTPIVWTRKPKKSK